ncbi:VWA domain-containing protein [Simulacricoccus sp. 17bor-14]|nr:VWA domain-containing protein [Simulacricoccus sp. 17bor-14]
MAALCGAGAGLWAGCSSPVDEPGSTVPGVCQAEAPVVAPQKTDILFVIDNSGSMLEEQGGIARQLPDFIARLQQGVDGVVQDFRVGVVTTSVYERADRNGDGVPEPTTQYPSQAGRLQPVRLADGTQTGERFLEGSDPQLVDKFGRLVVQGTDGSGQETPFEAVRRAVTPPLSDTPLAQGGNGGFLRDGARLLVVVVTDEDDCSSTEAEPPVFVTPLNPQAPRDDCSEQAAKLTPVSDYFQRFNALRDSTGARREVLWATIGPVGLADKTAQAVVADGRVKNVDCPNSYGPGLRQREMASLFDSQLVNLDSICRVDAQGQPSYGEALTRIASLAVTSQSIEVMNLPDPALAQVRLTRADGQVQICTTSSGQLAYEPSAVGRPARLYFQGSCLRRDTDKGVSVRLLCAG